MSVALAAAAGVLGVLAVIAPTASAVPVQGPPFPYADCLKATAKKGESPSHGKWHCDQLVKKGWVTPPNR